MQDVEMRGQCPVLSYVKPVPAVFTFTPAERRYVARLEGTVTSQTTFPYITQPPPALCQPAQRHVHCWSALPGHRPDDQTHEELFWYGGALWVFTSG